MNHEISPLDEKIYNFTIYDLMSADCTPWYTRNDKGELDLKIENDEETNEVCVYSGAHKGAHESLARFCKLFLEQYENNKEYL